MEIETLRNDIQSALSLVERKHGIKVSLGTITYSNTEFHCSLKAKTVDEAGSTQEADRAEWNLHCRKFGLLPEDFGLRVMINAGYAIVIGIKSRARKFPVLVRLDSGKTYVCAAEVVVGTRHKISNPAPRNVTPVVAAIMGPGSLANALM